MIYTSWKAHIAVPEPDVPMSKIPILLKRIKEEVRQGRVANNEQAIKEAIVREVLVNYLDYVEPGKRFIEKDVATGAMQRLTTDPLNGMYPTWGPRDAQLAFMTWRNGPTELFTMNANGTGQERLVSMASGSAIDPRWSPDGTHIAFVSVPEESAQAAQTGDQTRVIYVLEVATGRMRRVHR